MKKLKTLLVLGLSACMLASNASLYVHTAYATSTSDKDYTIGSAYWDSNDTKAIAFWDEANDKTSYKVRLYKGTKAIGNLATTSKATYDFTSLIVKNGTGSYRFEVYPTRGSKAAHNVKSDTLSVDSEYMSEMKKTVAKSTDKADASSNSTGGPGVAKSNTVTPQTSTTQTPGTQNIMASAVIVNATSGWNNYNNMWAFKKSDNAFAKSEWQQIGDKWYFFGANEFMNTGWLQSGDKWYYLDDVNGDMLTGWKQSDGKWYYLGSDGAMLLDTITPDNFRVDASGVWIP